MAFEEREDGYWLDGRRLDRVGEILDRAGVRDFSDIPEAKRELYLYRGKWVAACCAQISRGRFNAKKTLVGSGAKWAPYVVAFDQFLKQSGFKPLLIETAVYHPTLLYGGRLDFAGEWEKELWLPDIKLTQARTSTRLQTAAYLLALPSAKELHGYEHANQHHRRFGLELHADGKFKIRYYTDAEEEEDVNVFVSALNVVRWIGRKD